MRFFLLLLPILLFFSFREQSQIHKPDVKRIQSEDNYSRAFELFPNPTDDILKLQSSSLKKSEIKLYIFNVSGELVYKVDSLKFNSEEVSEIDISPLSSGLYFVQLRLNNYSATKKIVKL